MPTSGATQARRLVFDRLHSIGEKLYQAAWRDVVDRALRQAILFDTIGIVARLAVLTNRRGRSLECLRRLFVRIVQDLQGYEVRLKILGLLVEIRAAGPNIGLGLGVRFANIGNFGKCVVQ